MQYNLIYLDQNKELFMGDDIVLTFILKNNQDTIQSVFTGWTFKGRLENNGGGTGEMSGSTYFSTSTNILTLTIPHSLTINLQQGEYYLEIEGTLSSKINTIYKQVFYLNKELIV